MTRPCLNQRTVHREMLFGQQAQFIGQTHDFGEERFHDFVLEQPVAVLREHRMVPHGVLDRWSNEPAKQQVVAHLLHQHALAAHRVEHLQEQRTQQLLGCNQGTAGVGIDDAKQPVEPFQCFVDQQSNWSQRVIRRDGIIQLDRSKQSRGSCISSNPRIASIAKDYEHDIH